MKFNRQLKDQLERYGVSAVRPSNNLTQQITQQPAREKVVKGEILWKPIDKAAAMLIAKAPWWAHPPQIATPKAIQQLKPKKKTMHHNGQHSNIATASEGEFSIKGLVVTPDRFDVKGEPLYRVSDVQEAVIRCIEKMPRETRPSVHAAEDARRIVDELLKGLGGDVEKFKDSAASYLQDIRAVRFSVVTETAQMTKELKDVRQFFIGADHIEQIKRLREFVELCERLQSLKESGFLDKIADTMIRLA